MQLEDLISNFENVIDWAKRHDDDAGFVFIDYLQYAVDYIKQQLPRVMTYDEIQAAGSVNEDEYRDERMILVWLEIQRGPMSLVRPIYNYHPEWGDDDYYDSILLDFVGSTFDERFWPKDYNKTWRCWTKCPTKEQRRVAKWNE